MLACLQHTHDDLIEVHFFTFLRVKQHLYQLPGNCVVITSPELSGRNDGVRKKFILKLEF